MHHHRVWKKVHRDGLVPTELYETGTRQFVEKAVNSFHSDRTTCRACYNPHRGTCPVGIINPDNALRSTWDTFILLLVLYTGVAIPLQVGSFCMAVMHAWQQLIDVLVLE